MDTQLVVLGGGPGGYAAAFMAADLGLETTIVDQEPRLGGVCLLRGCIPSKALLHVAKALHETKHLADWGVTFAAPRIDLDALRARKEKVIATLSGGLAQLAKKRKVRVIRARAAFEDSQTLRLEPVGDPVPDTRLRFAHCILATGSSPAKIPALSLPTPRVMNSDGALELPDVPESLLVVGGGYIGLEMGTVYAALGSRVTVVEMLDGLLPGADRDLVKPLSRRLEKDFEAIYLSAKVASLAEKHDAIEVTFEGDVDKKTQRFSRVLVSVGRRPNSAGLGLEKTKVEVDAKGFVVVDDPHILAIGDVAGEPMLAHKAAHEGKVAAEVLAGHPATFAPRAIPAVVFTDPEVAWAGVTETEARQAGRAIETAVFPWGASGRAQAVGRTEGLTKWVVDPTTRRVIGCGIVGAGAGDLIGEAVVAIEMGASVEDLALSIHPHPTLGETLGAAAEVFLGTATDVYRPR
ncbi:MAG: dihydrolipoyl dehydrogenase [Thermoguttaceae bacterium]|nr:dihydrolipoyl dehydrogenase [Thermoguttaceae bacterium]